MWKYVTLKGFVFVSVDSVFAHIMHCLAEYMLALDVPSLCHYPVCDITAKHAVHILSLFDSHISRAFSELTTLHNSIGITPNWGLK